MNGKRVAVVSIIFLLVFISPNVRANLLQNSGFEDVSGDPSGDPLPGWHADSLGGYNKQNWSQQSSFDVFTDSSFYTINPTEGNYFAMMSKDGAISQRVDIQGGTQYDFSYQLFVPNNETTKLWSPFVQVKWFDQNDNYLANNDFFNDRNKNLEIGTLDNWNEHTDQIIAPSEAKKANVTVGFWWGVGNPESPALPLAWDQVSFGAHSSVPAAPEPVSSVLFTVGALAIAGLRRKKSQ